MTAIRLSPSGPVIGNAGGAPFSPGTGARLRFAEAGTIVAAGATSVIPSAANYAASVSIGPAIGTGPALAVSLPLPNVANNYRATALLDVKNTSTNTNGLVELYLEASFDGGATWTEQASNRHEIFGSLAGGTARQMRLDLPLRSGASMGMPVGAPSLILRSRIGASAGGGASLGLAVAGGDTGDAASKGAVLLQLEELF